MAFEVRGPDLPSKACLNSTPTARLYVVDALASNLGCDLDASADQSCENERQDWKSRITTTGTRIYIEFVTSRTRQVLTALHCLLLLLWVPSTASYQQEHLSWEGIELLLLLCSNSPSSSRTARWESPFHSLLLITSQSYSFDACSMQRADRFFLSSLVGLPDGNLREVFLQTHTPTPHLKMLKGFVMEVQRASH